VEEAIAKAFDAPFDQVKRANMLLGDIGETLLLAAAGKLSEARMRIFHPIDFMLASPVESAEEALSYFENAAVEDKYDGIRAQAQYQPGRSAPLLADSPTKSPNRFQNFLPPLAACRMERSSTARSSPGARVGWAVLPDGSPSR